MTKAFGSLGALGLAGQAAAERYLPGLADGSLIGALALHADVATADGTVSGVARNVADGAAAGAPRRGRGRCGGRRSSGSR